MNVPDDRPHVVRLVADPATEAIEAFRVIVVNGPRQSGKSTLLRDLHARTGGMLWNLDDEALVQSARADPDAITHTEAAFVYIDEVQRGGDPLVRAVKRAADDPNVATTFVLAGSTNFLTVPTIAESLAGRAVFIDVWPFSQGELRGHPDLFLTRLLDDPGSLRSGRPHALSRRDYFDAIVQGGFPEPQRLTSPRLRRAWFDGYVRTITQRDIVELSRIRQARDLPRLLRYLAGETAHELVKTKLAAAVGLDRGTVASYLPLLETVFLVQELPAWSRNPLGKVTKAPKLHLCDTGLAASLHGIEAAALDQPIAPLRGQFLETFVYNELIKQSTWTGNHVVLSHWRDREGAEVDVIVEADDGRVHGIEVKASSTVNAGDFGWLRRLGTPLDDQFAHGIVFYLGTMPLSFGPKLTALPVSALWS